MHQLYRWGAPARPAHTHRLPARWGRLLTVLAVLLSSTGAWAQLTGTKTIPGTYATLTAAITDLNAQGVGGGGVTFNIAAGYAETLASPTAGAITATGTAANPIVFQKAGTGANPLITAGVGTTAGLDAIISLAGSDYVTFNGLDVTESSANTTATAQMEFGYALFRPSTTDGCQNNTIRNCVVTLNKTNASTIGIAGLANPAGSTTTAAATATSGANTGNRVYGNVVTNAVTGINFAAASPVSIANYDQNNEIGSATAGTANVVGNFGGSATGWGAGGSYQNGLRIIGNTLNSTLNYTSATASTAVAASTVTSTLRGIYCNAGTSSNLDVTSNAVTLASGATTSVCYGLESSVGSTAAGTTVNLANNTFAISYTTATSGAVAGLYNTGSPATLNITGNTVSSISTSTTGSTYGIYNNHSATAANVLNNTVTGIARTGASGSVYGYYNNGSGAGTHTLTGNVFNNFTLATSSSFYGIYNTSAAGENQLWSANQVTNVTSSSSTSLYGIYCTYGNTGSQIFNNTVTGLSSTGTSAYGIYLANTSFTQVATYGNVVGGLALSGTAAAVYGIYTTVTTADYYRNKVYDLGATGSGASVVYGLYTAGGTTIRVYNNLIGNLTAPASTSLNALAGLYFSSGSTISAYFNTVYLNGSSSGATFGTSGLYFTSTPTTVDARNNVVVNLSTASGTGGYTAALRRSTGTAGTVPANYATTSNNNLYYAGAPSATNLVYVEGTTSATNPQQTLAAFKAFMANRDQASVTENPPFANTTTGTAANYLHVATGTATQLESGGQAISGITTDYDGDTRNASTPDIGADEGSFTPNDQTPPVITYTPLGSTGSTGSRALTVTITDPSGIATGTGAPRLYYRVGTSGSYASVTATNINGSSYTFTIPGAATGSTVQYYVAAQDASANSNVATSPAGGSGSNPPGSTAPATPNSYQILSVLSGTYYVTATGGSSPAPAREYATLTAAVAAYNTSGLGGAVTFVLLDASYSTGETFPLTLNNNADASATNTLTIRPGTGVAATITGSNAGALLTFNGARYVTLDGSNAGTASQNLTLANTSTSTSAQLVLLTSDATSQAASYDAVRNTVLTGAASTTTFTTLYGIRLTTATGATTGATNNTFSNNAVTKVQTGISVAGLSATVRDANTSITGNQIGSATAAAGFGGSAAVGIAASNQNTLTVTGNVVRNPVIVAAGAPSVVSTGGATTAAATALLSTATVVGIDLNSNITTATVANNTVRDLLTSGSSGATSPLAGIRLGTSVTAATVNANLITNVKTTAVGGYGAYGIYVNTATASAADVVSNNMVSDINGSNYSTFTNSSSAGIYLNSTQSGISVVYNSVNLYGSSTYGSAIAVATAPLAVESGSTGLTVQNNAFSNSLVAYNAAGTANTAARPFALYSAAPASAYTVLNNNDYFSSGSQAIDGSSAATSVVVYFGGASRYSLADVRTATTQDAASLSADPQFAAPNDLHTTATALNNAGAPVAGVTTDFDGETRSATTPDIGADEFTPQTNDLAAAGLVTPAATSTCYGTAEAVSVSVRNAGTATLNFASTPATVTVVVTTPTGTQTLTTTVNTGTLAPGASQTVTLPGTLNLSAVGTYSFAITATVQGDGNTSNDLLTPAPTRTVAAPVAGTLSPASGTLCVSGTVTLTLAGAANGSIQFQSSPDGTTFTDITGATSATYTTPVLTATTYYRAQVRCNSGVATSNVSTITVNNPQVTGTNGPVAICSGSTATITATASTGSQVRFFDAATGGVALTSATAGSYTTPALTASATYYAEAYSGGTSVAGLPDNSSTYGTFQQSTATDYPLGFAVTQATTLTSVDVYPTAAGALTIRLYSVSGSQPGGTATAVAGSDVTITVTAAQVGTRVTVPLNYQLAAGEYKLSNLVGSLGRFSAYTGTYPLTSTDGLLIVRGSYLYYSSTSYLNTTYNSFFNLTASSLCVGSTRTAIQVNVTQPGTASFPSATAATCGTAPYQLAGTVGGGATTGTYTSSGSGTFSPNATTLGATYTPSAADVTAGSVSITLTAPAAGGCPAATATLALTINAAPVATFSYPAGTYCAASTSTVTPTLGTGATAGTFTASPAGLTINATTGAVTLSSSAAGTYTVTNTVAASGACAAVSATATITVTPVASSAFSYGSGTYCASGTTNPTPTITGATGGTFTASPAGLTLNASTGVITLASSATGTYTVTYTVAGTCGSSSTQSVTITSAPLATFSYPSGTYCSVSGGTVTPTLGTGASAGTFTASPAGLTINATSGVITLSSSAAGTYTVTNTIAASGGCSASTATATITVTPGTTATFSYPAGPYCVSGTTNPTPTITGTAGGTFTSTTGLTISATTGVITLSSSTPGSYTVTYTVSGTCGSSSTQSVAITAAPLATFSYAAPASGCAGSTGTASPTLGAGATAGTFTASPAGLTINATTGVITLSSSAAGTYTVTNTLAASGVCAAAMATATYAVNATPATPTITVSGTPATGITLTSSAATGNQFYRNNVLIPGATGQSYTILSGAGNGSYTVTVTNAAGCSATSAAVTVTVTGTTAARNTQLTLHPNPTPNGQVTLELTGYRLATELTVLDALGRVVISRQLPANTGTAAYQLDLSGSASGVYVLRLRNADGVETRRLTRE